MNLSIDINVGIGGVPDSYFHTIINPKKYSAINFSKIFNFYWSCYFTILEDVLRFLSKNNEEYFDKYLCNDRISCSDILLNINELTKKLYEVDIELPENSYYALIKNRLGNHKDEMACCGIITTNYFRFCEEVFDKTGFNEVAYLNGQLKYFEYPENLEVDDLSVNDVMTDNIMFPFVFAQSLVKPIVNEKQIESFYHMKCILDESDMLVILGFNINEDDNHINSYLHDFVKKKPIIIITDNKNYDAKSKLKYDGENIHICNVKYGNNENVIDKMFKSIQEVLSERVEQQK